MVLQVTLPIALVIVEYYHVNWILHVGHARTAFRSEMTSLLGLVSIYPEIITGWSGKNHGGNITANGLDSHLNLPNRHKEEIN